MIFNVLLDMKGGENYFLGVYYDFLLYLYILNLWFRFFYFWNRYIYYILYFLGFRVVFFRDRFGGGGGWFSG